MLNDWLSIYGRLNRRNRAEMTRLIRLRLLFRRYPLEYLWLIFLNIAQIVFARKH